MLKLPLCINQPVQPQRFHRNDSQPGRHGRIFEVFNKQIGTAILSDRLLLDPTDHCGPLIKKTADSLRAEITARRQLNDLPDEIWTKVSIEFYADAADAVFKSLVE